MGGRKAGKVRNSEVKVRDYGVRALGGANVGAARSFLIGGDRDADVDSLDEL